MTGKVEKIIRPDVFMATTLDDISRKLSLLSKDIHNLEKVNSDILKTNSDILGIDNSILKTNSDMLKSNNDILKTSSNMLKSNNDILKIDNNISEKSNKILETSSGMLKEMLDERDEGEYLRRSGTLTTDFTILDIIGILGHMVKGWELHNDGNNTILFSHNAVIGGPESVIDVNNARFSTLLGGDNIAFRFNRRTIRNVYMRTESGTSDYRLWFVW